MEFRGQEGAIGEMGFSAAPPPLACASAFSDTGSARYHECLRNHAAALGGHVLDGCGEFMPGPAGDPLKCAACGCHRSFHRKDPSPDDRRLLLLASAHRAAQLPPSTRSPRPPSPLLLPPPPHPYASHPSGSGGGTTTESSSEERGPSSAPLPQAYGQLSSSAGAMPRKRYRTKFTPEQKEQMLCFAERLGWRMQKQDEALVEQFCARVGVRRQVLKVWMHNNKHTTITRRQQQQQPGPRQEQEEQTAPQQ